MRMRIITSIILAVVLSFFHLGFIHYQDSYESAIMWNRISGDVWLEESGGLHFSAPWVFAAKVELRPVRVSIMSGGRSYNSKLVKFNPKYFREFVAVEGTRYYWWSNRISFNFGYSEEYRGMKDILRGFAYATKNYPFLEVVTEYKEDGI